MAAKDLNQCFFEKGRFVQKAQHQQRLTFGKGLFFKKIMIYYVFLLLIYNNIHYNSPILNKNMKKLLCRKRFSALFVINMIFVPMAFTKEKGHGEYLNTLEKNLGAEANAYTEGDVKKKTEIALEYLRDNPKEDIKEVALIKEIHERYDSLSNKSPE